MNTALNKEDFKEKVGVKQYYFMVAQYKAMSEYCGILEERMKDLGIKLEE